MKVIDLLNKIANGEEVPKYVVYYNMLKDKTDTMMVCKENIFYKLDQLEIQLNSRVEVIEEDKKIEHLDIYNCFKVMGMDETGRLDENFTDISNKINEIIDKINGGTND